MSKTVAGKDARVVSDQRSVERGDGGSLYAIDGGRKYLNRAERQRVLAAAEFLCPDEALFILTLAWTGARVSEVLALTPMAFQIECGTPRSRPRRSMRTRVGRKKGRSPSGFGVSQAVSLPSSS